ncbi:MAG: alginate lyase family protein [Planctomycetes bacterium]|nr:alginate lyase family protein [Planctomycetota bacterium]
MQALRWYTRRLRSMSGQEICWRLAGRVREATDRVVWRARQKPVKLERILMAAPESLQVRSKAVGPHLADKLVLPANGAARTWARAAAAKANAICRNRLDLFDLQDQDLGSAIDWNHESKAGRSTPTGFAPAIDYRDYSITGDCKFVWEPNRHQHLVVLGRTFRLTGEARYATTLVDHLESWIAQCPYGVGMNWRSPLELGIRLINWCWALELIRPSGVLDEPRMARILPVVYRHLWDISRRYSRYSSANNHLIGEAAGVYIGGTYFSGLRGADRWRRESRDILCREIISQTHEDGGTREQATGYHLFVLEFFVLCYLVGRNTGEEFPDAYRERLERMLEFAAAFLEAGDPLPMFGDSDDGYVVDLGGRENLGRSLLAVGAALFGRPNLKALATGSHEPIFWLLGPEGYETYRRMETAPGRERLCSRALPESGYYLLQSGSRGSKDSISVTFDCGDLGLGPIAAHGHADALSFTLRAFGEDILVDPGTYDYFTYPAWRRYFRSTRAHNTVVIDDQDQSEMLGGFLWGKRARSRCVRWEPALQGGTVVGEHDGYLRLTGGVTHRRTISLIGHRGEIRVVDELTGPGLHRATVFLHLGESCSLEDMSGQRYVFAHGACRTTIELDDRLRTEMLRGAEDPIAGWVSRGYHRKAPAYALAGHCEWRNRLKLAMRILVDCHQPAERPLAFSGQEGRGK